MKKFISLFVLLAFNALKAQQVNFSWARQFGSPLTTQGDNSNALAKDNNGNVFVTGQFAGTVDFDPGPGSVTLHSFGSVDVFVIKLDAAGNLLWARQMGGPDGDVGHSLVSDAAGNVYITGAFSGTVNVNSWSGGFLMSSIGTSAFITKLDGSGNHIWTKQVGGTGIAMGQSIITDPAGSVYTTGLFVDTIDFDPGIGIFNISSVNSFDNYVLRLDVNGNFMWAAGLGGDIGSGSGDPSIALDNSGNAYISGTFEGTYDFDPGAAVYNFTSQGGTDIFVVKLAANGNFIWARQITGSSSDEEAWDIALDAIGNIFITGDFFNTVDFDPGAAVFNLTSLGNTDIFICKLNTDGNFVWAKQLGGVGEDIGFAIATDISGNVYTTGGFYGQAGLDTGPCIFNQGPGLSHDIFISKIDQAGNFLWAKSIAGAGMDAAYSIAITATGDIYTAGYFQQTADFDPSTRVYNMSALGNGDGFVFKMSPCSNSTSSTVSMTTCRALTINCTTYAVSGTYTVYLQNSMGCDSIVTLNLTIGMIPGSTSNITSCGSYVWNGQTYTTTGIYTDTLVTGNGCDSIATLNLTINTPAVSVSVLTSCGSYLWNGQTIAASGMYRDTLVAANGCDSIITLQITILPQLRETISRTICTGQQYEGYSFPGIYIDTLTASNGCDSIRTLHLSVITGPAPDLGDEQSICPGTTLKLYPGIFDAYVWQDGTSDSSLVVKQPGVYSVTVTNSCGTARDEVLVKEGTCSIWFPSAFTPNNDGSNDVFQLLGNLNPGNFQLSVYNRWGQLVFLTTDPSKGWNGLYKGQEQETGVFAWFCSFQKSNSPVFTTMKGTITLIR